MKHGIPCGGCGHPLGDHIDPRDRDPDHPSSTICRTCRRTVRGLAACVHYTPGLVNTVVAYWRAWRWADRYWRATRRT